jgi:EAL domain-containing protein (putative c-di-GMP-specific phosphodiesterase class I)
VQHAATSRWKTSDPVTVVITPDELTQPRLVDRLVTLLDAAGLAPQQLRLRIVGDAPLTLAPELLDGAEAVRSLGVALHVEVAG